MLQNGIIGVSSSPWCSPIVVMPKPDGSLRVCNDFCHLNQVAEFDCYTLPSVDDLTD